MDVVDDCTLLWIRANPCCSYVRTMTKKVWFYAQTHPKRSKCYWLNNDLIEQPKLHLNQKMMMPFNFLQLVTL